jgi:D-alanyl-D-alanine carboxypeptidase (penicillin-binding protein 5/6)
LHHRRKILCLLTILILIINAAPVSAGIKVSSQHGIKSSTLIYRSYLKRQRKAAPKGIAHRAGTYPEPRGKAAVLMDAASGRVLYSKNCHDRLPPAGLTKIMTTLLVVENGEINKKVEASEHAAKTPESTIYLQPGEVLTRLQLLYACMLHSANDAATDLAESTAGSEPAFVKLMNQRAKQLGMCDTHYKNPHGLEIKGHYTSAFDLALVTRQAMANPIFCQVVATRSISIPWADHAQDRILLNENRLFYRYPGTIGVKTGYTRQAGNCVVGAAKRGKLVLIAVSLNSPTVYDDLEQMLDFGFTHYQNLTLIKASLISVKVKVLRAICNCSRQTSH